MYTVLLEPKVIVNLENMAKSLRLLYQYQKFFLVLVIFTSKVIRPASSNNVKRYVVSSLGSAADNLKEKLPKAITKYNADLGYLLTKLSDDELIQVLKEGDNTFSKENSNQDGFNNLKLLNYDQLYLNSDKNQPSRQKAYFKLHNKEIDPYSTSNRNEYQLNRVEMERHLKNILYNYPRVKNHKNKYKKGEKSIFTEHSSKNEAIDDSINSKSKQRITDPFQGSDYVKEHLFLILNDELTNKDQDELVAVDPDSLSDESKILILGPITKPLSDAKLLKLMKRIENELSKKQYVPFLEHIAKEYPHNQHGSITTRRYMKPHRCNHQSKLARVYGGPKWLICTGYMNLNGPSLYD